MSEACVVSRPGCHFRLDCSRSTHNSQVGWKRKRGVGGGGGDAPAQFLLGQVSCISMLLQARKTARLRFKIVKQHHLLQLLVSHKAYDYGYCTCREEGAATVCPAKG